MLCYVGHDEGRRPFHRRVCHRNSSHAGAHTHFRPSRADTVQSMFQNLLECAAQLGFDVDTLDISGRPRLFRIDDGLVRQLKLCARPEVLAL